MRADVAQLVEHSLGKGEVTSSILVIGSRVEFDAQVMSDVAFEQAGIKVEKTEEFDQLRGALERAFRGGQVGKFLKALESRRIPVRNFEAVLEKRVLERVDGALAGSGKAAKALYQSLAVSDQAQIREFYLVALENVEPGLRRKFQNIYR